jgi:hypothetical protein
MNDAVGYLPPVGLGDVMRGLHSALSSSRGRAGSTKVIMSTAMGGWGMQRRPGRRVAVHIVFRPAPDARNMSVLGMTKKLTPGRGVTTALAQSDHMVVSAAGAGRFDRRRNCKGREGGSSGFRRTAKCRWLVD